jgi:nifR3 family TIM-barrel protein
LAAWLWSAEKCCLLGGIAGAWVGTLIGSIEPLRCILSDLGLSDLGLSDLALTSPSGATVVSRPAVILAPMAGITNAAYRQLCREQAEAVSPPGSGVASGLYVCEMITARGVVERNPKTFDMLRFGAGEQTRSVQLYGVDPGVMAQAGEILCAEFGVNHIDLNFGCPVPKVTRRGGGGALPWKRDRLAAILRATVRAADRFGVPVTIKTRLGIDADHLTYRDAGRIAQDNGCAAFALHGRTVAQAYSGQADWEPIAEMTAELDIPVLGNGDIWEAADALAMVAQTGCAGVVVGRGCLGRPWLFRDLADAFAGRSGQRLPSLGEVAAIVRRHAELLAELHGERPGLTDLRKHMAWYFKGFRVGGEVRRALAMVSSLAELDQLLSRLDAAEPFPAGELGVPRGRQGTPRDRVVMPSGWLDSTELGDADLRAAECDVSGG